MQNKKAQHKYLFVVCLFCFAAVCLWFKYFKGYKPAHLESNDLTFCGHLKVLNVQFLKTYIFV